MRSARRTFSEAYPQYLQAHRDPRTRFIHACALLGGITIGLSGIAQRKSKRILAGLAFGYLPAFVSHGFVEKNQPTTFEQPVLSFASDSVLVYHVLTGTPIVPEDVPTQT